MSSLCQAVISRLSEVCANGSWAWHKIFILSYLRGGKPPLQSDQAQSSLLKWNSRAERGLRAQERDYPQWAMSRVPSREPGAGCVRSGNRPPTSSPALPLGHHTSARSAQMLRGQPRPGSERANDPIDFKLSVYHVKEQGQTRKQDQGNKVKKHPISPET